MADSKDTGQNLAAGILGGFSGGLANLRPDANANSQPTPQSRAAEAQRTDRLRSTRLAAQAQINRAAAQDIGRHGVARRGGRGTTAQEY